MLDLSTDDAFEFDDAGEAPLADTLFRTESGPLGDFEFAAAGVAADPAAAPAEAAAGRLITGTRFADNLRGTNRDDDIFARGAADVVRGRGGDDLLDGGAGADQLFGGGGRDALFGGGGRDSLYGGAGRDDFFFDNDHLYDKVLDFRAGDKLVVDGEQGDFAGARWRNIDLDGGPRFDELYVFNELVARIYGDVVIRDDILLLT